MTTGNWAHEMRYAEKCADLIDPVIDEVPGHEHDVVREYMSHICDECSRDTKDMTERQLMLHRIYRGVVLVCCEGYWMIDPSLVGEDDGYWQDWTKLSDSEDEILRGVEEQDEIDRTTEEPDEDED